MSSAAAALNLRQSQNLPISKPRAVYSIDQILGTQHHRRNNTNINNNGKTSSVAVIIDRDTLVQGPLFPANDDEGVPAEWRL